MAVLVGVAVFVGVLVGVAVFVGLEITNGVFVAVGDGGSGPVIGVAVGVFVGGGV